MNGSLFFQNVSISTPPHIRLEDVPLKENCSSTPIGYRMMCKFHSITVYDQPIMSGLDYAWKLDDDSKFRKKIPYDVFLKMRDNNCVYGYKKILNDNPGCVLGLWEATCKYVREQGINPKFFGSWKHPATYYNNFEISKVSLWRSCEYQRYFDYLDRLGGIFFYRWGDGPIKSIAVSLFAEKESVHQFSDINYVHQRIS